MKKVRIIDISKAAGVGTATVERVLNARGNVSPAMAEKIVATAKRLGYDRQLPNTYRGIIRIEVILVRPDTSFYRRMAKAIMLISSAIDRSVVIHKTFVDENDPGAAAEAILKPPFQRSGLIVALPNHHFIGQSLTRIHEKGTQIVSIVSRLEASGLETHVGVDNYHAGRTAAHLMTNMNRHLAGQFVAICHGGDYLAHQERIRGFSNIFLSGSEAHHGLSYVICDKGDHEVAAAHLTRLLSDDPTIIGVYNAGGGNRKLHRTISQARKRRPLFWVGHELVQSTRLYLEAGEMDIVIDQAPEAQVKRAIDIVLSRIGMISEPVDTAPIPFRIHTRENM